MTDKTKLKLLVDNFNFKLLSKVWASKSVYFLRIRAFVKVYRFAYAHFIIYDYGRFEVASNPIVIKTKDNL